MQSRLLGALSLVAALTLLGLSALAHSAAVVNIEFTDGAYTPPLDAVYTEDGFTFSVPDGNHTDTGPLGAGAFGITPFLVYGWHNGGGNAVVDNDVLLERGGAAFDLVSLDTVDDIFGQNQVNPEPFTIDFISSAGDMLMVDGNDIQTIGFGWTGITSVTMSVNDAPGCILDTCRHNALIDNVVLTPIPTALWLFGSGLLGLIGIARQREKIA